MPPPSFFHDTDLLERMFGVLGMALTAGNVYTAFVRMRSTAAAESVCAVVANTGAGDARDACIGGTFGLFNLHPCTNM